MFCNPSVPVLRFAFHQLGISFLGTGFFFLVFDYDFGKRRARRRFEFIFNFFFCVFDELVGEFKFDVWHSTVFKAPELLPTSHPSKVTSPFDLPACSISPITLFFLQVIRISAFSNAPFSLATPPVPFIANASFIATTSHSPPVSAFSHLLSSYLVPDPPVPFRHTEKTGFWPRPLPTQMQRETIAMAINRVNLNPDIDELPLSPATAEALHGFSRAHRPRKRTARPALFMAFSGPHRSSSPSSWLRSRPTHHARSGTRRQGLPAVAPAKPSRPSVPWSRPIRADPRTSSQAGSRCRRSAMGSERQSRSQPSRQPSGSPSRKPAKLRLRFQQRTTLSAARRPTNRAPPRATAAPPRPNYPIPKPRSTQANGKDHRHRPRHDELVHGRA